MAVVEAVENIRYREDGGSAYLTTRVKILDTLKGEFGDVLDVTQGVVNGGSPGRYTTEDPDRYAVLEPGRRYVIAVQSGSTAGTAGSEAWAWYAEWGLAREREHWQEAIATPPETAANSACEDIDAAAPLAALHADEQLADALLAGPGGDVLRDLDLGSRLRALVLPAPGLSGGRPLPLRQHPAAAAPDTPAAVPAHRRQAAQAKTAGRGR